MASVLVIDLGTTYFKFTRFDRDGRLCATVSLAPPLCSPRPGRLELEVDAFCEVLIRGIGQLRERAGEADWAAVEAISFATQTNSFLLMDAAGKPLTPILLWPDRCGGSGRGGTAAVRRGGLCHDDRGTPAQSLLHDRQAPLAPAPPCVRMAVDAEAVPDQRLPGLAHDRRARHRGRRLGLDGLGGYPRTPMVAGNARPAGNRRSLFAGRAPCRERPGKDSPRVGGEVRTAADVSLHPGSVLDQYAGAIGCGNVLPGLISETTGTVLAAVAFAESRGEDLGPSVFQGPAFASNSYYRMAFGEVSANYLESYRNSLCDRPDFALLAALAEEVAPGADGLRLNTNDPPPSAADLFTGRTPPHSRGQAVRSIFEAVAVALRGQVHWLGQQALLVEIRSAGGAVRSDLWLQIKADVLGVSFRGSQCPEPTSLGAAILAEATRSGAEVPQIAGQWYVWAIRIIPTRRTTVVTRPSSPSPSSRRNRSQAAGDWLICRPV